MIAEIAADANSAYLPSNEVEDATMEYYRRSRFACGKFIASSIVTSLAVNTIFNPSLALLIQEMIASNIIQLPVSREFSRLTYFEAFNSLLMDRDGLLPVGLFRKALQGDRVGATDKRIGDDDDDEDGYVFAAPLGKNTKLRLGDILICLSPTNIQTN